MGERQGARAWVNGKRCRVRAKREDTYTARMHPRTHTTHSRMHPHITCTHDTHAPTQRAGKKILVREHEKNIFG